MLPVTLIACIPMSNFRGCAVINMLNALVLLVYASVLLYIKPFLAHYLFLSAVLQAAMQGVGCFLVAVAFFASNPDSQLVVAGGFLFEASLYVLLLQLLVDLVLWPFSWKKCLQRPSAEVHTKGEQESTFLGDLPIGEDRTPSTELPAYSALMPIIETFTSAQLQSDTSFQRDTPRCERGLVSCKTSPRNPRVTIPSQSRPRSPRSPRSSRPHGRVRERLPRCSTGGGNTSRVRGRSLDGSTPAVEMASTPSRSFAGHSANILVQTPRSRHRNRQTSTA